MQKNKLFTDDLTAIIPSEEKMSAMEWLAEQMPGGFFIYRADDSTELLYVNSSVCDIFGCSSVDEFREYTGNTFKGMVHPDDYDSIQSSIDNQIAMNSNSRHMDYVVYRIIRKDGTIRWVDDYGHFATLPGYGDVYYVFIGDITETKLAKEETERANTLAIALEEAEQANVAKSAFLSNMSHEIRTPITAILGMNEMIQREAEDSAILDYSENIRKAGVSLLGIISDILDFSKIETGKMELQCEKYAPDALIRDLYNLIRFRAEAKGLTLHFEIDSEIPKELIGDEIRIKQIITNILTNAVKYTEEGNVNFAMKLKEKSSDFVTMEISVTDTGIGIKKEDMDKLFEPFDRLDSKKTRSIEGSGLGLAITRQLLSLMDSELKVESTYEKGSKFYFTLTQKIGNDTPIGDITEEFLLHDNSGQAHGQTSFIAPGMRLLVVDDTPMNLQVIAGLLKRTRMHIDVASSGAECIEKFGAEHYDMVFLDYRMPHMNGIETLTEIKNKYPEKFEKTPIISLTASAVSGDKEKMLSAGFTDYLTKPVNIDEMERMMCKYLPDDSVFMIGDEVNDETSKLPKIAFDYPELDPAKGIEYCGDAEDYIYALETYEMSVDAKAEQIENNLKDNDMDAYVLNVHSLKSTSSAIGAVSMFEKAKALEMAGKDKDFATIQRDTPFLIKEYKELKAIIHRIIQNYEANDETAAKPLDVVEEARSQMLAKALEEAEHANMAKTAFLSNMSHEIRTPMNAIIGLDNIALKNPDIDSETRDILVKIGASAKHLLSLINDILDISRVESGKAKLKNEEFSFGNMLEQINTMTESQCKDKGLVFDCLVKGHMDDFYVGDEMKMKQVVINVLGNAVKYTPAPGKVTFTVEETERTDERAVVRFVIKDTGVGMDADYIPKIFEPFSQEKEGTSNQYGSTGLGMAITKNIVDMMCGQIGVQSEKGKGSEFTITIPLGISKKEIGEAGFDPTTLTTLIVDDDATACEHAKMVLARIGIEADYVLSGKEALTAMEKKESLKSPYKLVLVDWRMPQMDGVELTRAIRKRYGDDDITVILTTYNWDDIMEEALDAGVDAFMAKPLFAGSIQQELKKIVEGSREKSRGDAHKASLTGRKILLAEDMNINAQIMKQILKMKEISADVATNGEEAVKLFEGSDVSHYDAILMDIRMPVMNGLEATKAIRALGREDAAKIPIIALTANAFDEDVQLSLDAGMNAHLSKPIEPDALFGTLEKLITD
ncbi:PAS domain S-box-containing protein [Butyrivibrio sp. ob235]|uniref:response regulator n=1 Tax=Butyrivibrio sp. ob235 TaxID=1761780 RepID=UPI0008B386C4|nr:response regulator [Butyrivibrio sp. ob235]SEL37154.1 PAS domain S-box-containing protein [Butyrivibrio sp. ob235]